jgi:hypothetical protein
MQKNPATGAIWHMNMDKRCDEINIIKKEQIWMACGHLELIMTIPPLVLKNQTIENPIYYWLPSITPVV